MAPQSQPSSAGFPVEVEGKYRVEDPQLFFHLLQATGAEFVKEEEHCDTYLRHPCRDFRITDEALRIREIDGCLWLTYKGPRLEGTLKIRPEIEVELSASSLESWQKIWAALGFQDVHQVSKKRQVYRLALERREVIVTLDHVRGLGNFSEIERIVDDAAGLVQAREDIENVAMQLCLHHVEKRSYLSMILEIER
jgi:adenylate cyclase class 2